MGSNRDKTNLASEIQRQGASKLAELALERYGLPDARFHLLRQEGFAQVAQVVSADKGEFAVRMYRAAPPHRTVVRSDTEVRSGVRLRSSETLEAQLLWLSALGRETDLLVPEPVPMSDGSLLGYVSFSGYHGEHHPEHRGRYCTLLRWVPGSHIREELSLEQLSLLGSYIAKLHNHAQRYHIPQETPLPRWGWHWPFGERARLWREGHSFYSTTEMGVFEETARRVREDLERLGYGSDVYGLIHRDLHLGNIVFDGGRVGTIDFDTCGLGHYLLDLAVLLNAPRLRQGSGHFGAVREALLKGYERERSLPSGYRRHFMTFPAMRKVAAVNRELRALDSAADHHRARGPRLLRNALMWLQSNYLKDER